MLLEYLTSPNIYLNICLQFTFKITILCRIRIWNLSDWSFTDGSLFLTLNYVHHSPTYQSQINWFYVQNCMFKTYWFRLNLPFNFTKNSFQNIIGYNILGKNPQTLTRSSLLSTNENFYWWNDILYIIRKKLNWIH